MNAKIEWEARKKLSNGDLNKNIQYVGLIVLKICM